MTRLGALVVAASLLASLSTAQPAPQSTGSAAPTTKTVIKVDHRTVGPLVSRHVTLRDGEEFTILVQKTLPELFKYELQAFKQLPSGPVSFALGAYAEADLVDQPAPGVHHKEYGGYLLRVTQVAGITSPVKVGSSVTLADFSLLLAVTTAGWEIETAGAFTASRLKDPQYYLDENKLVSRNKGAEDVATLGAGVFIHLYHTAHPKVAMSFGVSINNSNRTTYYLGPSLRLGGKAFLTAGVTAGPVARLPTGVLLGQELTEQNALANLPTRTSWSAFVSVSYSFLGASDVLKKPFEGPAPSK